MSSRDKIVAAIRQAQPEKVLLPEIKNFTENPAAAEQFVTTLQTIGGHVEFINNYSEIEEALPGLLGKQKRIVSTIPALHTFTEKLSPGIDPHSLADVDVAIIESHFGVAENGAVWITEELLEERALPFIAQHLVVVLRKASIVANMHRAYDRIATAAYGYGTFISGPSKTADIEQSLVLGAHGPKSMLVFILNPPGDSSAGPS